MQAKLYIDFPHKKHFARIKLTDNARIKNLLTKSAEKVRNDLIKLLKLINAKLKNYWNNT